LPAPQFDCRQLITKGGRKRSIEQLISISYAKYGATEGVLQRQLDSNIHCSILCGGWPDWAIGAYTRGWVVDLIIVKDSGWSSCIHTWFPNSKVVSYEQCLKWSSLGVTSSIWLSDVDPPRKLSLWDTSALFIVTRRRARHIPNSLWKSEFLKASHVACGGVTDGSWDINVYRKTHLSPIGPLASVGSHDLSTVFDTKLQGIPCPPPSEIKSSFPQVVQVRPNTFHGGGLLPWGSRRDFVIAPCIFSPTNWVRRRVHGREMLKILDIPDVFADVLESN